MVFINHSASTARDLLVGSVKQSAYGRELSRICEQYKKLILTQIVANPLPILKLDGKNAFESKSASATSLEGRFIHPGKHQRPLFVAT
jgi:hypothetical protein